MSIPLTRLGFRFAYARAGRATGWLDIFVLTAYTVSSWLAITVAAGTNLFYHRSSSPPDSLYRAVLASYDFGAFPAVLETYSIIYLMLAGLACLLLVFPIFGLGAAAARLSALGHSKRLAVLRLLGCTRPQAVRLTLLESGVLATAGFTLGSGLFVAVLPFWQLISFQGQPLSPNEMWLPVWLWAAVGGTVLILSCLATIVGLNQVIISPLSVARGQLPKALRLWRLWVFIAVIIAATLISIGMQNIWYGGLQYVVLLIIIFFVLLLGGLNLIAPLILQAIARLSARIGSPSCLLAARRIAANPKETWYSISSLAFLGFLSAWAIVFAQYFIYPSNLGHLFIHMLSSDIRTGALITLLFCLLSLAVTTMLNQSSRILARLSHSTALDNMGLPHRLSSRARLFETVFPPALVLALAMFLGSFGTFIIGLIDWAPIRITFPVLVALYLLCLGLVAVSSQICNPLERRLLHQNPSRVE